MNRTIHLIGVPSSAGAHWPGQEKAPAVFREAGLVEGLRDNPGGFYDRGDLEVSRWRVDRTAVNGHLVNNLDATIAVAESVAEEVAGTLEAGGFPVALGGDCTITVGACAGVLRAGADPVLVYVDGDWDLGTPETYSKGILDSMGTAHMLGVDGTTQLRDIGPRFPILGRDQYIQFGHIPEAPDSPERPLIDELDLPSVPASDIRGRGELAARETLERHLAPERPYFLHFDVDVIDFFDFPVADVPEYDVAVPYEDAIAAVGVFASDPRCIGMTVTEFNPDHAHPDGREATRLANDLAAVLTAGA
ncbi:MAG TPA: arginase family protein [Thermomicrobiales bacterium]|nr:arginase family protein [Thermomicrobiales bacterium]